VSLTVVYPPLVGGVLVVKKMPMVVICEYAQPTELGAILLGGFPKPAISGKPWPISPTLQGFIFDKVPAGKHFLFLFDLVPPGFALKFLQVSVEPAKDVKPFAGIQSSSPTDDSCFSGTTVWSWGTTDADPTTIVGTMTCALGHTFTSGPPLTSDSEWFISINITEDPRHQPYSFKVVDGLGNSSTASNIQVSPPGGCP